MKHEEGFTLIEMLVSLVLAALVLTWLSGSITHSSRNWREGFVSTLSRDAMMRAQILFSQDMRHFTIDEEKPSFNENSFVFQLLDRDHRRVFIRYVRSDNGTIRRMSRSGNSIQWKDDGILLHDVPSPAFRYFRQDDEWLPRVVSINGTGISAEIPAHWPMILGRTP